MTAVEICTLTRRLMNEVTLEEIFALNEELAALDEAGVPIELGDPTQTTREALAKINARLALRSSLGQPIQGALTEEVEFPPMYQHALLAGLESNQLPLALDGVSRQPIAWDDIRNTLGQALVQPLVILALAYCGFIFLCLRYAPTLESIYEQIRVTPSWGLQLLLLGRAWMFVWVPLVPLLVVAGIYSWQRQTNPHKPWLPGSQRYFATVTRSVFAEQVASLLEAGVPLPHSLRLAGKSSNDSELIAASEALATAQENNQPLSAVDEVRLNAFPPLLRWALTGNLGGEPLPEVLRFIAETYRQSAERQSGVWHFTLPTLIGAFLGGLIVLFYCLSLFGPYVQMLHTLAY